MSSTVLDSLERMSEYSVSSVPVIDQSDHVIGNISMTDVRVGFLPFIDTHELF